jgi:hypothetical protein
MFSMFFVHLFLANCQVRGQNKRSHKHRNPDRPLIKMLFGFFQRNFVVGLKKHQNNKESTKILTLSKFAVAKVHKIMPIVMASTEE